MADSARLDEIREKEQKLQILMEKRDLAGILLTQQKNFFWATAGGGNPVMLNYDPGFQSVVFTRTGRYVLSQQVEMPRIQEEETADLGFEYVQYNWWEENLPETVRGITGGTFGADMDIPGADNVNADVAAMRPDLTEGEVTRFREIGKDAAACVEETARRVGKGMTESEIGANLLGKTYARGLRAHVLLVGNDERVYKYRHPVPTPKKLQNYVMIVLCAERYGLIAAVTRLVHLGPVPQDLTDRYSAVKNVAATINLASVPGSTMGNAIDKAIASYAENGFPEEWQKHYQGGVCGYAPREVGGGPGSGFVFKANQALAWNPTITGTKIEDTYIIGNDGLENITATASWPSSSVRVPEGELTLPEILVL